MARRFYHSYPTVPKHRRGYAKLFSNDEDRAKMAYIKDMEFRRFVAEWHSESAELLGWSLKDFYSAYYKYGKTAQLSLGLA
jgi:hypothetical protein